MGEFSGKSVIVTGAASGIGRAAARLFAAQGATVTASDLSPAVEETAAMIRDAGGTAIAVQGDAGVEGDIVALIDAACAAHGGLDVLFANAGVSGVGSAMGLFDATPDHWAEVLRINLIGPFLAIKHGAPRIMERGGGAIVCTASVAGLRSGAGPASYSASKAGVINLVQTAAQQLTGTNVRINAICPGLIETGMTKFVYDHARATGKMDRIGAFTPLQRGGEPEEIARVALFLASEAASYMTGQALVVDGGLSTSHPGPRLRLEDMPAARTA